MNITQVFDVANVFVLPFWALMILLPNWEVTKKVMTSYIPFLILAIAYIYCFIISINAIPADSAAALLNPTLSDIARLFADERATAAGWTHFLTLDLFLGRWIYWEGQRTGVWTIHSLILCLFAGPIGLFSHIVTAAIAEQFFPAKDELTVDS